MQYVTDAALHIRRIFEGGSYLHANLDLGLVGLVDGMSEALCESCAFGHYITGLLSFFIGCTILPMKRLNGTSGNSLHGDRIADAKRVDDLVHFERLLSEVSAKYINMPVEEIETAIREDFGHLASLLGGDSCNFHMFDQENQDWFTLFESSEKVFLWVRRKEFAEELRDFRSQPDFAEKMQHMFEQWDKGNHTMYPDADNRSKKAEKMGRFIHTTNITSFVSVPINASGNRVGAIVVATHGRMAAWSYDIVSKIRLFGEVVANALVRKRTEEALRRALSDVQRLLSDVKQLKDQIEADYVYLAEEINLENDFADMIGKSQALRQILVKVKQVAPTTATVLLLGETGTGKGVVARAIHNASPRSHRPLIQVNCAALTPSLVESELFGHEKGAFTGAVARRVGRFEIAHGTTLFLDEIGDLPLDLQAKLLRVLQEGEFERVGGTTTIKTDARVIAATNKDLQEEVDKGRFRSDLWYRLSVFPILVPPLRERTDDIPLLISYFVNKHEKRVGKRFDTISHKAINALQNYRWPGNIRELENFIERAVIASPGGILQLEIPALAVSKDLLTEKANFQEVEKKFLLGALNKAHWRIEGPHGAASVAGLPPSTFRLHMRRLGIVRPGSAH
jgi:formate hydrogenlyase transcriptional activator